MSFSACRAWSSLFLSALETEATASFLYLPPGHSCAIDYPTKLKPDGAQSHIYSRVHESTDEGPFYTVDVAIVGCYGGGKFLETTFVVPSLEPRAPLQEYSVEYDMTLEVYIVRRASPSAAEAQTTTKGQASLRQQNDVDEWFDAGYIGFEDVEDRGIYDDQNDVFLGRFSVENFPVMSPKGGDVNYQQSLERSARARPGACQILDSSDTNGKPTTTQTPAPSEEEKLAELLQPESFDWADEFDEETFPATEPSQSQDTDMLRYESFDWSEESDNELAATGTNDNQVVVYSQPNEAYAPLVVSSLPSHPSSPNPFESDEQQESGPVSLDTEDQYGMEDGMMLYDEDGQKDTELAMHARSLYEHNMCRANWESSFQWCQTENYPYIHHFNWLGYGIVGPSETPAEVSLAVILSGPKMWVCENPTSREAVTLCRAFQYVDPVLYEGDVGALSLRGSELQKTVTGATSKFYTSYGTWANDSYGGDEERPMLDPMDVDFYVGQPCTFINGWLSQESTPTRDAELNKFQNYVGMSAWEFAKKKGQPYRVSHLRRSLTADGDGESSSQCARVLRVVRGSMQYWAHDGGQTAGEVSPEPEAEVEEDASPSNGESSASDSRRTSSESTDTAPSESTEATTINSADNESLSPPAPRLAIRKTAIDRIRRRLSFPDLRTESVVAASEASTSQNEEARKSSPSLVLPPLVVPRNRPHHPEKPAAVASPVHEPPSTKQAPKARYVRLQAKSALAQATVTIVYGVPVLSMPAQETEMQTAGGQKRVWKRAWKRIKRAMRL